MCNWLHSEFAVDASAAAESISSWLVGRGTVQFDGKYSRTSERANGIQKARRPTLRLQINFDKSLHSQSKQEDQAV
jgi:hypothetical protein